MCLQGIIGVAIGHFGRHTAYVAINYPQDLFVWAKFTFAAELLATPIGITFAKLSILFFFRRLFPVRSMRIATAAVGAFVVAHGLSALLVVVFQCTPVRKAWALATPGTCIDVMAWSRSLSAPNILSDLALLALPLPQVWRLHTGTAQKVGLTVAFTLGGFNVVASAVRMSMFFTQYLGADPFMSAVPLHSWSILEAGSAVVAACLPSLYPFFKRAAQRHLSRRAPTPGGTLQSLRLRLQRKAKQSSAASSGWHWSRRMRSEAHDTQRSSMDATVVGDGVPSVRESKIEVEQRVEVAREAEAAPTVRAVEMAGTEPWREDVERGEPEAAVSPVSPDEQNRLPLQRI